MTAYLTLGDIVDIRDRYATDDPWRFEIVNSPGLLTAISTPFQFAFGIEAFPSLIDKAAALTFLLIANHPFRDGNKRIAGVALRLFLERNGYLLTANEDEIRDLTLRITRSSDPRDAEVLAWLHHHSTVIDRD
jgi:death-on-curing protein